MGNLGWFFKPNNMKLYTEEQVFKAMDGFYGSDCTMRDVIDRLTPIELPSDDEIRVHTQFATNDFYWGAKWMKQQILKQNK